MSHSVKKQLQDVERLQDEAGPKACYGRNADIPQQDMGRFSDMAHEMLEPTSPEHAEGGQPPEEA